MLTGKSLRILLNNNNLLRELCVAYAGRSLKNGNFCLSSRKAKISTTGIYGIFRGLKFEPDAEIGQKVPFRSLRLSAKVSQV